MTVSEVTGGFIITFPFNPKIVAAVKEIDGARFRSQQKFWFVPARQEQAVIDLKKKFAPAEREEDIANAPEVVGEIPELPELQQKIDLKRPLFPYQERGAAYNLIHKRSIVGDKPGLGKTSQSIATVQAAGAYPCLVICPATIKRKWAEEWMTVAGKRAMILTDKTKMSWSQYYHVGMVDVFITNFESLKKFFVEAINQPPGSPLRLNHIIFRETVGLFRSVIVDELHKCKDGSTQRAKFVMGVTRGKEYVLGLTGTPLVNKPKDLVAQLHIINRLQDFGGYKYFMTRYCEGGTGAKNLKELNYKLRTTCFYQREKHEVLKDLPPKIRQVVMCDITNRAEYQKAQDDFVKYLQQVKGCSDKEVAKKMRGEALVKMGALREISARGKFNEVQDWAEDVLESGEKVILFCNLKEIVGKLKEIFSAYRPLTITGADSEADRHRNMKLFQTDDRYPLIICNIKAAGVGLDLYRASNVGFVEYPWTFADCEQCEDRAHRIGQTDSVSCAYFLGVRTIDRYCYDLIMEKKNLAQLVTGSSDGVSEEIVDRLLTLFNQKTDIDEAA